MKKDQLSWEEFYKECKNRASLPTKVKEFNRLVAHTKNFFIISGYGAFTPGYLLLISKDFLPSFGKVHSSELDELNFTIKIIKEVINQELNRKSVVFEHGMCACIGGLDRAHIHVMSIHNKSNEKTISDSINSVLYNRKAGIEYIEYKNYKLQNIHDINQIYEDIVSKREKSNDYKVVGNLLKIDDVKNLSEDKWPHVTLDHIENGGHYVYFKSSYLNSSFLTKKNFQTQFGRQVIYENEMDLSFEFRSQINKLIDENKFLEPWKWQSCIFEENLIKTVNDMRNSLKNNKNSFLNEVHTFEFKVL